MALGSSLSGDAEQQLVISTLLSSCFRNPMKEFMHSYSLFE